MELREYVAPLRKWWWLILITTVGAGAAGFLFAGQRPEVYRTHATLQIGQSIIEDPNPTTSVLWVSQQLALTYADISHRSAVRNAAMEALGMDWLPTYNVRHVEDTQLLEIEVTDTDPVRAQAVANELANQLILQSPTDTEQDERERQAFINQQLDDLENKILATQEEIDDQQTVLAGLFSARQIAETENEIVQLQSKLSDLQTNYANLLANSKRGAVNTLIVIEEAALPISAIGPGVTMGAILAAVVGFVLSTSAVYLIEFLDDSIRTPDDINKLTGLPTLAGIAQIKNNEEDADLITISHPRSPISEAYRVLRTGIQFSNVDSPDQTTVLLTSANPTEGKSITAANLAVVMAQAGHNVLLLDGDLRRPRQHKLFHLSKDQGLTNFLLEYNLSGSEQEALRLLENYVKPSSVAGLYVFPSGPVPPNPSELLGSAKMRALLALLSDQYDFVIVDSPPALAVTDSVLLSTRVDAVLLICDAGRTKKAQLSQVVDQLEEISAHVIGVVLNRLSPRGDGYYYYYYYRNRYYEADKPGDRTPEANGQPTNGSSRRWRRRQSSDIEI